MDHDAAATGERFAAVLDAGDWEGLRSMLAPGCTYACRGTVFEGAEAIADSYREVDEWVKRTFERVRYTSEVEAIESRRVRIAFRDQIDHGEHHLDFRCHQLAMLDAEGRITHIEHVDLPGMRERADAFNCACGVERP